MENPLRLRPWHVADLGTVAPHEREALAGRLGRRDQMCVVYRGRAVGSVDLSDDAVRIEIAEDCEEDYDAAELRAQVTTMLRSRA